MKVQPLGKSELEVSEIAFGCMSLPENSQEAEVIIDEAVSLGINYFDTADLYGHGKNEELVGRALKKHRDRIVLATKVGNEWSPETGDVSWNPTKSYITGQVKESLRRLGTDTIDLYQLHGGMIEDNAEETVEAFEQLKREGLIRAYGISSIRPNVIRRFLDMSAIDSNMMQYSLLDRRPEELLDEIHAAGVSVVTRGTLAKGLLTGEALERAALQDGYLSYSKDELFGTLKELLSVHSNLHALALHSVLSHDAVTSVVAGASSRQQLRDTIQAYKTPVSAEQITEAKSLTKADRYDKHRD
ncbi:aldo/keto reductase [Planococcus lenghuensis]|uniref:Oxidoreductase n=1 Tax=Planococcus lenghuensis TaxID=2213202 RepID=A0A1Q2L0T6_9BACL|nr:aldo/keto reductase [Planococcus lenghuensis]AQQ53667.1 oxidoreductase [Planococcus lenghuensis]